MTLWSVFIIHVALKINFSGFITELDYQKHTLKKYINLMMIDAIK